MKKLTALCLVTSIQILLFGTNVLAVTKTITQSGNWSSTTTWGGNSVPVAGDDVIISGGFMVTIDISNAACASIQLGGSTLGTGTGTLAFNAGSQVTISGALNIGPFNNNNTAGSLTMTAGGTLTCASIILGKLGTWAEGTGTIELTATNTVPANTQINFNNLTMSGGTTSLVRNVTVSGNLLINSGASLDGGTITLTLLGNFTNNGTFTGSTGLVSFDKNGNQTITGTGINNFNLIKVNLGTSIANTLEVLSSNFNAPDAFLTLTNGTFKMSGTFTFSNTFFAGPIYNIQPGTGLWINNPNVTVTAQVGGGAAVKGLLRLSAGTINVGTAADNILDYVTGSVITIEGGSLNIAGRLTRNNATQTTTYTQTGGTVRVVTQGSTDPAFAGFDLGVVGSSFTMSGGTIVVSNATSAPVDFLNAASVSNVTGGTLQIGDVNTANAQTIRIQSSRPVGNLLISNATTQAVKPTAQLITSGLTVVGNVTIQQGTTLNTNGLNLSLGGDWSDTGSFTSGGNTVTFNGSVAQAITNPNGETFNNLIVSKAAGTLTMNSSVTVNNSLNLTQGTFTVGSSTFMLNGTVTGGGILSSGSTGTVIYSQGSDGQNILAGNYGNLTFSNFNKTLATTGIIGIAGTFNPGSAAGHIITGSTFDFNGGAQSVASFNYNNLTLSGSGTKTGSGTLTVTGNFTNNAGIIFSGTTVLTLNGVTHINSGTINTSTLSVGIGGTLNNNGTITISSALNGSGTLTQGSTGILNLGGTAGITVLDASASGNTVNYTGASQTLTPGTYHHLALSGSGTPVLTGVSNINGNLTISGTLTTTATTGMTIGGNVTIGAGTIFNASAFTHIIKGNLSNAGTFNAGTSTITMGGTVPQTISAITFNNLSIANINGVSMLGDVTINSSLALTSGSFFIGAHTLNLTGAVVSSGGSIVGGTTSNMVVGGAGASTTLPSVTLNNLNLNRAAGISLGGDITVDGALAITNGTLNTGASTVILGTGGTLSEVAGQPIVGNVKTTRNITITSGTELFGNIGADIALNGAAPGSTTILRKTGTASTGNAHTSILRYFDITPTVNTGLNADLVFHYDASELNGQNANLLELYKSSDNGINWKNAGGIVNAVSKTITVTGINDFSRWTSSDTINRIGNTATPTILSVNPASKIIGNPAFILTINGTNFIDGKSTVRFNGSDRTTTFVNSTQLTVSIPATDLLVLGQFPLTVFNLGGGGLSNAKTFTVIPDLPTKVRLETAADGSGTVIPSQSLASGSSITLYAISRDVSDNFIANVAANTWTVENITGGVVIGDLAPSVDRKSAVFTGHASGTCDIKATSGTLTVLTSGILTVTSITGIGVSMQVSNTSIQNYPNPFNSTTTISYHLSAYGHVVLKIFDVNGRELISLVNKEEEAGDKSVIFDAGHLVGGIYYCRLQAGNSVETTKLLINR